VVPTKIFANSLGRNIVAQELYYILIFLDIFYINRRSKLTNYILECPKYMFTNLFT